jgi:hypothetical protein
VQSQPNGVKMKMRGRKLRSGVNWPDIKQKRCKSNRCKTRVTGILFLIIRIVTVTIHNVSRSTNDKEYKSRSFG